MGKKKDKKEQKELKAIRLKPKNLKNLLRQNVKSKCCKKYKKGEKKRCGRCPCYDLLKEVA
jgi:hypothetical protein